MSIIIFFAMTIFQLTIRVAITRSEKVLSECLKFLTSAQGSIANLMRLTTHQLFIISITTFANFNHCRRLVATTYYSYATTEKTVVTFFIHPEYRNGESTLQENQTNKITQIIDPIEAKCDLLVKYANTYINYEIYEYL